MGGHGVLVGNDQGGSMAELALTRGEDRLRVFVDAEATRDVSRVVFALGEPGITVTAARAGSRDIRRHKASNHAPAGGQDRTTAGKDIAT